MFLYLTCREIQNTGTTVQTAIRADRITIIQPTNFGCYIAIGDFYLECVEASSVVESRVAQTLAQQERS